MTDAEIVKPDPSLPHAEQPGLVLAALTLYGEARGEKVLGKKAVLWTIKNRRRIAREFVAKRGRAHPLFGDGSLASCVLKKYQFSCWLSNDPNLHVLSQIVETEGESMGSGAWAVYYALALKVEAEGPEKDPTFGATHYCTKDIWEKEHTLAWYGQPQIEDGITQERVQIGNHVFAVTDLKPVRKPVGGLT